MLDHPEKTPALFFTPSFTKILLLSLLSFGTYPYYWFYRNWQIIRLTRDPSISPFWRSVVAPIWAYDCFRRIRAVAIERNFEEILPIMGLAAAYVILQVYTWFDSFGVFPDTYGVIPFLSCLPILWVNKVALDVNLSQGSSVAPFDGLDIYEWGFIFFGALCWSFTLVVTFLFT